MSTPVDWPGLDDLKQVLNVSGDEWDDRFEIVIAAAIDRVKTDVGTWDEDVDMPDARLSQAAMRMAELVAERPSSIPSPQEWAALAKDPTYATLIVGHRKVFGIS